MRKLFSGRRRFIGLGLMSALVIALAVLGALWGFSQRASADPGVGVTLVHVQPDGTNYTGNPYCPDTTWVAGKPTVNPAHDCNNIIGSLHIIATEGYGLIADDDGDSPAAVGAPEPPSLCNGLDNDGDGTADDGACQDEDPINGADDDGDTLVDEDPPNVLSWNISPPGSATIVAQDNCWTINESFFRPNYDPMRNNEQCLVIESVLPGETNISLTYGFGLTAPGQWTNINITPRVVKEWDSLIDSVILKYGDLEKVKVYGGYDANGDTIIQTTEYKELYLPLDANGDGKRDQLDEHLLDKQGVWQEHPVVFDEALKRIKSSPPVQIIEVVHGEHLVLLNGVYGLFHQPTEGAIVTATIESPRNCTFFTDELGSASSGPKTKNAVSDNLGRVTVYVDTVCEEQAKIKFHVTYPGHPGSYKEPLDEWVGINWTTVELAKQPQIRWAGEEIVLATRWALPDDWYPNKYPAPSTQVQPHCPLATIGGAVYSDEDGDTVDDTVVTHHVNYVLLDPGLGALEGGYVDINGDGILDTLAFMGQSEARGDIDKWCISKALAGSEHPGQQDSEAKLMEDTYYCPPLAAFDGPTAAAGNSLVHGEIYYDSIDGAWECSYPDYQGPYSYRASLRSSVLINKHAFLVWFLKIYQVKLTNVPGTWSEHNQGSFSAADGADITDPSAGDVEAETLNVSATAVQRVVVKGWFFGGNLSSHGAVCVDMDGDGDGIDNDGDTLFGEDKDDDVDNDGDTKIDEDLEAGVPYPITNEDVGCPDAADEMLENGHWVLPDDLPALAGPDAINTRPNWDVMSDIGDSPGYTGAIGPKSTLDSHDAVLRSWVGRKTVDPDGEITEADAIMPPLKIRASIADGDAGFVPFGVGKTSDLGLYGAIMIPADPEIPAIVINGGYDWMSYGMPPCTDLDADWVCDAGADGIAGNADDDNCLGVSNPNQSDVDGDKIGDVCETGTDFDGDTILNDGDASGVIGDATCVHGDTTLCDDNCVLKSNATQADGDSDGVGTVCDVDDTDAGTQATDLDNDLDGDIDSADNCPSKANADQKDIDGDGIGDVCDAFPATPFGQAPPVPYPFWTILNKFEREDAKETNPALKKAPYKIEFYTDNRGWGFFAANGDFMLGYDKCRIDPVSGAPDCSPDKVVGSSTITVIGDYPYFRKHPAVLSNPVEKTWTWGGYKDVEALPIDANHTAIIAHLVDRDGFCKYEVKADPTAAKGVTTSPSLHPVQGEEIEFILNTDVGRIIEVSPNGVYSPPAPHDPLTEAMVLRLEDGTIIDRSEAVALAEDGRVLDYFDEARGIEEGLVAEEDCQAWIVVEHPLGEEPNVSVRFHDPEGVILRHWPPSELIVQLVQGWNDSCYAGPEANIEDAMADIIDNVLAVYRYNADQTWDQYFPGRCEEAEGLCTFDTLMPYDQLFILMAASAEWVQLIQAMPTSVDLVGASATDDVPGAWNSVCYVGAAKATEEATRDIESGFAIMYSLGNDQAWRRYVPARPEIPDTLTTLHRFDSVLLLVTTEGGMTWVFDP